MDPNTQTPPTDPTAATTTESDASPADDLFADAGIDFDAGDVPGLDFLFDGDEGGDGSPPPVEEPTAPSKEPLKASAQEPTSALERARKKYEERAAARKDKHLAAQLAAERQQREELAKKLENPLETIGGVKGLNQLARDITDGKYEVKTPEQLAREQERQELEELKAWRKEQLDREAKAKADAARAEEVAYISKELDAKADDYPFLSSAGWAPNVVHEKVEELLDAGQATSVEEAFAVMDGWASHSANHFKKNKRALKKMFAEDAEAQTAVMDVLEELGIVNAKNRSAVRRAMAEAPNTLSNELKDDFSPVKDGEPPDEDTIRRNMIALIGGMQRRGGLKVPETEGSN